MSEIKKLPVVLFWLFLRVYSLIMAAWFSLLFPITEIEKNIRFSFPIVYTKELLYRLFISPWIRWDTVMYIRLTAGQYAANDGSTSFHPLFPLLSRIPYYLGVDPGLSILIVSSISTLGVFLCYFQLARLDLDLDDSWLALLYFASFPISVILFFPYTEAVFLFFSILVLFELRRKNWAMAALFIYLASLTRQQGIFLFFPILWCIWNESKHSLRNIFSAWKPILVLISSPLGLFSWSAYRIFILKEGVNNIRSIQDIIYNIFISPSAKIIIPDQAILPPWDVFIQALPKLLSGPEIGDLVSVLLGFGFLLLFFLAWKNLHPMYRIYCLVLFLVSFSMSTGPFRIYLSLPRHLILADPLFIGLAPVIKNKWQQMSLIGVHFSLQLFLILFFVAKTWIP